ncbi:MAG: GNAT family N-acetyltransferase [Propionibacteriaceae bacterium]
MNEVTVEALTEDQWSAYRSIRLEALQESPGAFTSSFAEESDHDEPRWRACMLRAQRLLAVRDGRPTGVVSVGPSRSKDLSADLFGLWVKPTSRNTGVAWRLVEAAGEHALANGWTHLDYWVGTQNGRAIGFATNFGFRVTSQRRSARVPSEEFGDQELALTLPLTGDPGVPNPMGPRFAARSGPAGEAHGSRAEAGSSRSTEHQ